MRDRFMILLLFFGGMLLLSSPGAAQVYFPTADAHRDPQSVAAAKVAPTPPHDPHDLSGVWLGKGGALLPDKAVPPFTPLGQKLFNANKPSQYARTGTPAPGHYIPAFGNDPLAKCDPLGHLATGGRGVRVRSDSRQDRADIREWPQNPRNLDRRAKASRGPGSQMVRMGGWSLGGRHPRRGVRGGHDERSCGWIRMVIPIAMRCISLSVTAIPMP